MEGRQRSRNRLRSGNGCIAKLETNRMKEHRCSIPSMTPSFPISKGIHCSTKPITSPISFCRPNTVKDSSRQWNSPSHRRSHRPRRHSDIRNIQALVGCFVRSHHSVRLGSCSVELTTYSTVCSSEEVFKKDATLLRFKRTTIQTPPAYGQSRDHEPS